MLLASAVGGPVLALKIRAQALSPNFESPKVLGPLHHYNPNFGSKETHVKMIDNFDGNLENYEKPRLQ